MSDETIELALVGDVYVQRPDPDSTFAHVEKYLRAADIAFGNLETVVADLEHLDGGGHGPRTDEWMISAYVNAGFKMMNLANNPSMYRGVKGLLRTMDVLDKAGIAYGGGGKNLQEARRPTVVERKGVKVAFVCRTSVCTIDAAATAQRLGLYRKKCRGRLLLSTRFPMPPTSRHCARILRRPESVRMWWLFHGTGESPRIAAGKASSWGTKQRWLTSRWMPAPISSSGTILISCSPSKCTKGNRFFILSPTSFTTGHLSGVRNKTRSWCATAYAAAKSVKFVSFPAASTSRISQCC